jgi:TIR domain.
MSFGYFIGFWWQTKQHGGEILAELERNNKRVIEDLDFEFPGIKNQITEVIARFRAIEFDEGMTYQLYEQMTEAIAEHIRKVGRTSESDKPITQVGQNRATSESRIRNQVFISYSHKDTKWLERLQIHLQPLERLGLVNRWDDSLIKPGENWREEIKEAIESAKVAVLLISADFLASDFVSTNELPPLLASAQEKGAVILPLIVSPCRFEETKSLSQFQSVNPPSRPLTKMTPNNREEVFVALTRAIENALQIK